MYESKFLKALAAQEMAAQEMAVINWRKVFPQWRNETLELMQIQSVKKCVGKSSYVAVMSLALKNVNHETYFSRLLNIDFMTFDISLIPKIESNRRTLPVRDVTANTLIKR